MLFPILVSILLSALLQIFLWMRAVNRNNAGWVDFGWASGMAIAGAVILLDAGFSPRALLVCSVFLFWSLRLAWHIYADRLSGAREEDSRYRALRQHWGENANFHFLWFFLGQSLLVGLFMLPALTVSRRGGPFPDVFDLLGVLIALLAIAGEALADRQLAVFRRDPSTKGRVCDHGLWKLTRHPNYFFEWLHWWGYVVMGIGAPMAFLTLSGPIFMYVFLRYVTGVPHAERQSLRSRGDAYRKYQQTTPVFFPWIRPKS